MEYLIQVFGAIPLSSVIIFVAAVAFLVSLWKKVHIMIVTEHDARQEKDNLIMQIASDIQELKQKQDKMETAILEVKSQQIEIADRQNIIEEENKERTLNQLRDRLVQSYRYYTNEKENPLHAWSEMEKEAFEKLFKDYEALGGNGFVHKVIEPAVEKLEVVSMTNNARFSQLMRSRMG